MIAAGEVVQRPASVVKELMENAIDASATSVSVVISDSGRTLIQVIDNGCGMSPEDAVTCFERHATSKISSAEDLSAIMTYGFRGEALASIAAVSEVTLKTRREGDETATQVVIDGLGQLSKSETSAPKGSNFAVRNLFFNTPARRKFLKSDTVEMKHIIEEFIRVSLTRPDVSFSLVHNGKDVFCLKPAKTPKYRILNLLGDSVAGDIVDIHADTSILTLDGYVGRPDAAKKTLGNQYFFVNGRYFRSAYLHKAVMKAYEGFIPDGVTPSYFLFLDVNPESIDVNIHPKKTEIKFEDDSVVFQTIYACVKENLGKNSFAGGLDFDTEGAVDIPVISSRFGEFRQVDVPSGPVDPTYNPFNPAPVAPGFEFDGRQFDSRPSFGDAPVDRTENYGKLFEDKVLPSTNVLILHGKYIFSPARSGMMMVNIRRAQERILFEKFLRINRNEGHVVQKSLFPVSVQVGAGNRLLFDGNEELLKRMGFDISPFGMDTIVVNGVPEGYSCESGKVQETVADLIQLLSDGVKSLPETMASNLASRFAQLGAAHSDAPSTPFEAQKMIDTLLTCENAEFTSSGKRIITIITDEELDKKLQ